MPVLTSEVSEKDVEQMLAYYKANFAEVSVTRCSKCKSYLCFELAGGVDSMGLQPNEVGKYIIPIGDKLLSHRVRLDEAPNGERMVGYQCECGNDTRIADVERGAVPVAMHQTSLSPFEKHQITEKIREGNYKADFKQIGKRKHFETFMVERVQ